MNGKTYPNKSVLLFGIPIDKLNQRELISNILHLAGAGKSIVAYANIKTMNLAYEQPWYAEFLNLADLVYCDGFGVVLGTRLAGRPLQGDHRATCPDWLELLARGCAKDGLSIFLLAGIQETAEKAKKRLNGRFPTLKLAVHNGYFEKQGAENERVVRQINEFQPDILVIGFGTPLQERWIEQNYQGINTHVFLPVGACLDYYTGLRSRGPAWLTNNGFEWLCRLLTEPRRLWHRYVVGIPIFLCRAIWSRFFPRQQPVRIPRKTTLQGSTGSYAEQDN